MPIGTAERPINIKDLILEEPERTRELPFDPERDLTKEDWRNMRRELSRCRYTDCWSEFAHTASSMRLLNPSVDLGLDEEAWNGMRVRLDGIRSDKKWKDFLQLASRMKLLDSSFTLDDVVWGEISEELNRMRRVGYGFWDILIREAAAVKLLNPSYDLKLDHRVWTGMHQQLVKDRNENAWNPFALHASDMRLLDPSCNLDLGVTEWRKMREAFSYNREKGFWDCIASGASRLKILAAEEVKITENGLEIIMRKPRTDFTPSTPPMPEVRRF